MTKDKPPLQTMDPRDLEARIEDLWQTREDSLACLLHEHARRRAEKQGEQIRRLTLAVTILTGVVTFLTVTSVTLQVLSLACAQ